VTPELTEQALLARIAEGGSSPPRTEIPAGGEPVASELEAALGAPALVVVRTPSTSDASFGALVLVDPSASPGHALDAALSCAEACFGVTPSRFATALPDRVASGAEPGADEALARLAVASRVELPRPGWERVAFVLRRGRTRASRSPFLVLAVPRDATFGVLASRDARTGESPPRVVTGASPRMLVEPRAPDRELSAASSIPEATREKLADVALAAEAALEKPVRIAFAVAGGALFVMGVTPVRRAGLASFALAADLVARGATSPEASLRLVSPRDVSSAARLSMELDPAATVVRGIAAGPGIVEGYVCLTPAEVLAFEGAGLPAVLFAHEIMPDDLPAVRASAGVVTVRGGLTGEAAVMARGLAKPCVASGASLTLAANEVRIAEGGAFARGERVTVDGSTGVVARGAFALSRSDEGPAVARVIETATKLGTRVVAHVSRPEHVVTASRLGADGVAIHTAAVLFEALRDGSRPSLQERVAAIFAAARDRFAMVSRTAAEGASLPAPVSRTIGADEVARLDEAGRVASAETGVAFEAAAPPPTSAPQAVLEARIEAAQRAAVTNASG